MVKTQTVRKITWKKTFKCAMYALLCLPLILLVPPFSKASEAEERRYAVAWEDGAFTAETYASAAPFVVGCDGRGVLLFREGKTGAVLNEELARAAALLGEGDLLSLLGAQISLSDGLSRLALHRRFGNTGYYAGSFFAFDGVSVLPTERTRFFEVVLLEGGVSSAVLRATGAQKLTLRAEAELSAASLAGSAVTQISAQTPYVFSDGALFLETPFGVRLVAALPGLRSLSVEEADFCDKGALSPCEELESLVLPFSGNAPRMWDGYDGSLAYCFGGEVPKSLKRLELLGGLLPAFALAGSALEEADLCALPAEAVSPYAFSGCESLKMLHTSCKNLYLEGNFTARELPCGCMLYLRVEAKT